MGDAANFVGSIGSEYLIRIVVTIGTPLVFGAGLTSAYPGAVLSTVVNVAM